MKKILVLIMVMTISCVSIACEKETSEGNKDEVYTVKTVERTRKVATTGEEITDVAITEEITTEEEVNEEWLSDSCDHVLATGYDEETDDFYELVANEKEDYSGVTVKIGVIKNNKWLLKPTKDMPLVDEDGTLYGEKRGGLVDVPESIYYLGKGCFLYRSYQSPSNANGFGDIEDIVYNVNNNKYYEQVENSNYGHPMIVTVKEGYKGEEEFVSPKSDFIITKCINYDNEYGITMLNFVTMETKEITIDTSDIANEFRKCYPVSEGIFVIANHYGGCKFYNTKGKLVGSISDIELTELDQKIFFENNKCKINIINNNGNIYEITVNKKGKVINQDE